MTPRELPPTSESDYSFLIRTASQLSHISFPLLCRVRQEFSPRFNIYPALLYLYQEFLPRIEWGALGEGGWHDINHGNLLPICRCKPISRLAFKRTSVNIPLQMYSDTDDVQVLFTPVSQIPRPSLLHYRQLCVSRSQLSVDTSHFLCDRVTKRQKAAGSHVNFILSSW